MSSDLPGLTACVIFAFYDMTCTSLVATLKDGGRGFSVGAVTVVGLATAIPLWSDHFLWWFYTA